MQTIEWASDMDLALLLSTIATIFGSFCPTKTNFSDHRSVGSLLALRLSRIRSTAGLSALLFELSGIGKIDSCPPTSYRRRLAAAGIPAKIRQGEMTG